MQGLTINIQTSKGKILAVIFNTDHSKEEQRPKKTVLVDTQGLARELTMLKERKMCTFVFDVNFFSVSKSEKE